MQIILTVKIFPQTRKNIQNFDNIPGLKFYCITNSFKELKRQLQNRFPHQCHTYLCNIEGTDESTGRPQIKLGNLDGFAGDALKHLKDSIGKDFPDSQNGKTDTGPTFDTETKLQEIFVKRAQPFFIGRNDELKILVDFLAGKSIDGKNLEKMNNEKQQPGSGDFGPSPWDQSGSSLMFLSGSRGIGKTALLVQLVKQMQSTQVGVYKNFKA